MFTFLRSKKKSITNILLAGFLALLMMGWGANLYSGRNGPRNHSDAAIKVNGEKITYAQFNKRLNDIRQMYRDRFGRAFDQIEQTINLEQQAVDSVIDDRLSEEFIKSLKLVVAKSQVQNKIFASPFFQKIGLSQESYRQFLQANGLTGDQLEQIVEKDIANEMIETVVADLSTPTPAEFKNWLSSENTKHDFTYAEISAENFAAQATPKDDAELEAYFEKNKEQYRHPKTVRYSYVKFKPSDFESKVVVDEEDLKELYQQQKTSFGEKTFAEVRPQLEAAVRANEAPQYSRVEAQNFLDGYIDAKDTKSLADYAKEKGMTVTSSEKLLLPNETPHDDKDAEGLSARLGNASVGEPQIVELPAADFVVVADETKDAFIPPLSEVKAEVLTNFKSKRSKELAKESADKLLAALTTEQPTAIKEKLTEKAKAFKGEVKTEKGLTKGDDSGATPVFAAASTKQVIFGLTAQAPLAPKVFEMGDKYYVVAFSGSSPATDEETKKVFAEFKVTERSERTDRLMREIKQALRKDADIWIDKDIIDKAAG